MQKVGSSSEGSSPAVAVSTAAAKAIAAKPHACLGAKKDETLPRGVPACVRDGSALASFTPRPGLRLGLAAAVATQRSASGVAGEKKPSVFKNPQAHL